MKRKRKEELPLELGTILSELNEQSLKLYAEHERKTMVLSAELEQKRREQEQQHEERILGMMMSFIQQVAGAPQVPPQTPPFTTHFPLPPSGHCYPPPSSHPAPSSHPPPNSHNIVYPPPDSQDNS